MVSLVVHEDSLRRIENNRSQQLDLLHDLQKTERIEVLVQFLLCLSEKHMLPIHSLFVSTS
jgi:hypothetical protein